MPEYLAPGVFVEETSFRSKSIAGVGTRVAGFVGPTRRRPADVRPNPMASFADFERVYGGLAPLDSAIGPIPNYVAHAARAFFANGGRRLYVAPVDVGADATAYAGAGDETASHASGLKALEAVEEIAIVAAPGAAAVQADDFKAAVAEGLIAHCERMRYRFALLDPPHGQSVQAVRSYRARFDSTHAALYYPWIAVADPLGGAAIHLPPSGFLAGLYARSDARRGVHKAPANLGLQLAAGLERNLTQADSALLNPEGINCIRFFKGRGTMVWGARTLSSDPEWIYVSLRRCVSYLERSIEKGTLWTVFEPNTPRLWNEVRAAIEAFLYGEWRSGALLGATPEQAFFVRCDRSTMTQNDVDNGRLVCLIGVALIKPAEFVIFRIGQWTADRQS